MEGPLERRDGGQGEAVNISLAKHESRQRLTHLLFNRLAFLVLKYKLYLEGETRSELGKFWPYRQALLGVSESLLESVSSLPGVDSRVQEPLIFESDDGGIRQAVEQQWPNGAPYYTNGMVVYPQMQ